MKVPVALKIAVLTVVATGFYTYVGQLVPQKEVIPPEAPQELATDLTTAQMVEIGRGLVEGRGLCLTCHTIGQNVPNARFPDLAGIAERAGQRVPGMGQLEYLVQSLYDPEAFIVSGFAGGMPVVDQPPVGLSDDEIRTVIAYLQTLGGEPTITMETPLRPGEEGEAPTTTTSEAGAEAEAPSPPVPGGEGRGEGGPASAERSPEEASS